MKETPKPWEIDPSLEESRLQAIGGLIIDISNECTDLHDEASGDGPWSLGCRIYERVENRLIAISESGVWPWLKAYRQRTALEFSVMIGNCLVRYYRGDADNPTCMQLVRAEEMQRHFGFLLDDPDEAFTWFIVLERDQQNRGLRVVVQQANSDGVVRHQWVAAKADHPNDVNNVVTPMMKPAQDVGAPEITPKSESEDEGKNKQSRQK